jgi:hypothetical protein
MAAAITSLLCTARRLDAETYLEEQAPVSEWTVCPYVTSDAPVRGVNVEIEENVA